MDNLTHSLAGIAFADLAARPKTSKADRRLLVGAGIVSANLPDLDLIYTSIVPAPLGYLLHHRGHTHTVAGVLVLAVLMALAYHGLPPVRRMRLLDRARLWLVIVAGTGSHLAMDALNSYGVHPYYPVDRRWYFGDAVFIFEPGLWVLLGISAAASARGRAGRIAALVPAVVLPAAMGAFGIVPPESMFALAAIAVPFWLMAGRVGARARAAAACAGAALVIGVCVMSSQVARGRAAVLLDPQGTAALADIVLTPNPAAPWCWGVIAIEVNQSTDAYTLRRGALSLVPQWRSGETCPSHRVAGARTARRLGGGAFAEREPIRQRLSALGDAARRDCWADAWLRFGRVPVVDGSEIYDLRFADVTARGNFSRMRLAGARECPSFVPGWDRPREDLLRAATSR